MFVFERLDLSGRTLRPPSSTQWSAYVFSDAVGRQLMPAKREEVRTSSYCKDLRSTQLARSTVDMTAFRVFGYEKARVSSSSNAGLALKRRSSIPTLYVNADSLVRQGTARRGSPAPKARAFRGRS